MQTSAWSARLVRDRKARGLSQRQAVDELRQHTDSALPDTDSLLRTWKRWEAGTAQKPSPEYQSALAAMFSSVPHAYFNEPSEPHLPRLSDDQTVDLVQRLRATSIDDSVLDSMRLTVDQLCTDYSTSDTLTLRADTQRWLTELSNVLNSGLNYRQHGQTLELAGWLSLLTACLHWDAGDEDAAEAARSSAVRLGTDLDHHEILGWGAEISAWMALTRRDWRAVIAEAQHGIEATDRHSVSVQLYAQQAKAYSRLGERSSAERALEAGRALMARLPYPNNPRNHFCVDPVKVDFYAMDVWRITGADELAAAAADTVQQVSVSPSGKRLSPMRLAEAQLTQATVLARSGDLGSALSVADEALAGDRKSLPSLLMVGNELATELRHIDPEGTRSSDFLTHLRDLGKSASI